jgi:hypothetical protein
MNEAGMEVPSSNFVNKVMERVQEEVATSQTPVYQPVISKRAWVMILAAFVICSVFLLTGSSEFTLDFLSFDVNMTSWVEQINIFSELQIADLITISILVFTLMVMIQLFVLKNYTINKIVMS